MSNDVLPFFSDCVDWPTDRMDLLHSLIDDSEDIALEEFTRAIGEKALSRLSRHLGYNRELPLSGDLHVRYARHPAGPVMMVHSAIEHVFATKAQLDSIEAGEITADTQALILVHPGSMCGSARMHMGRDAANAARHDVFERVRNHSGAFFAIDGAPSDELSADESREIDLAVMRALAAGHPAGRYWGCDSGEKPYGSWAGLGDGQTVFGSQEEAASEIAPKISGFRVLVTGAWAGSNANEGCVNSVANTIRETLGRGALVGIDETALPMPSEYVDECDDNERLGL